MMPDKQISNKFQSLQTGRHQLGANESLSLFETTPHTEYWQLSDILNTLTKNEFTLTYPKQRLLTQTEIYNIFDFSPIRTKNNQISDLDFFTKHAAHLKDQNTNDLSLTRYAVYNIIYHLYPNNAFELLYFLLPPDTPIEQIYAESENFKRIAARERLKQQERNLAGVIKKYSANFSTVQSIIQNIFFGNIDMHKIKAYHYIPDKSPTADYMGARSLNAKNDAIYNVINHIDTSRLHYNNFIYLLQESTATERNNMLHKYGVTPEHDIYRQPISKTQSLFNQIRRDFIKKYAFETLR